MIGEWGGSYFRVKSAL